MWAGLVYAGALVLADRLNHPAPPLLNPRPGPPHYGRATHPQPEENPVIEPNGCRHCGDRLDHHGWQWHPEVGLHQWVRPTDEQIKARMLARRVSRTA